MTHGRSCLAAIPLETGDLGVFEHAPAPRVALAHAKRNLVELDGYNAGHPHAPCRRDGRVAQTGAGVENPARRRHTRVVRNSSSARQRPFYSLSAIGWSVSRLVGRSIG